jgi:hypothetical protein
LGGISMSRIEAFLYGLFGALILFSIQGIINHYTIPPANKPIVRHVQEFRFYEKCPDGLSVSYTSTIRLPKSMHCQKAIGE